MQTLTVQLFLYITFSKYIYIKYYENIYFNQPG